MKLTPLFKASEQNEEKKGSDDEHQNYKELKL
jgi:hypothetical protein